VAAGTTTEWRLNRVWEGGQGEKSEGRGGEAWEGRGNWRSDVGAKKQKGVRNEGCIKGNEKRVERARGRAGRARCERERGIKKQCKNAKRYNYRGEKVALIQRERWSERRGGRGSRQLEKGKGFWGSKKKDRKSGTGPGGRNGEWEAWGNRKGVKESRRRGEGQGFLF